MSTRLGTVSVHVSMKPATFVNDVANRILLPSVADNRAENLRRILLITYEAVYLCCIASTIHGQTVADNRKLKTSVVRV